MTPASGGADWLPAIGDQVVVQFLDSEPEKPLWSWMMQSIAAAKSFPLHSYDETGGRVGKPKRGAWTRYGHTVEWNEGSLIVTTKGGYRVFLLDGDTDGRATVNTQLGQYLEFDDGTLSATLNVLEDFYAIVGQEMNILANSVRLETVAEMNAFVGANLDLTIGGSLTTSADMDIALIAGAEASLEAGTTLTLRSVNDTILDFGSDLNLGAGANEPYVLGTQLTSFLQSLLLYLTTHTHSNGNEGSPTGPPIVPPLAQVTPDVRLLVSKVIFGK